MTGPSDKPRKRTPPPRPPQRPRPKPKPPIYYQDPPIRRGPPALSGAIGAIGIIILIVVGVIAFRNCKGPDSESDNGSLPNVSIEGAQPCEFSNSPRINMDSQSRIDACIAAKRHAKARLTQKGQAEQFDCLDNLWENESAWSAWAVNPSSGAWGIAQILPSAHPNPKVNGKPVKKGDWKSQVEWGLNYIWGRQDYGGPCAAWRLWQERSPHWY